MSTPKQPRKFPLQMNWKPSEDDLRLMKELSAALGVSDSDILRLGIRSLAKQELAGSKAAD